MLLHHNLASADWYKRDSHVRKKAISALSYSDKLQGLHVAGREEKGEDSRKLPGLVTYISLGIVCSFCR